MSSEMIARDFQEKVCSKIRLMPEGYQRYRVFTPFLFQDGDHLAIVLKNEDGRWYLTDEGHTYMHLTYDLDEKDLRRGARQKIITHALSTFYVEDRDGELTMAVENDRYGDALFSFVQALMRISDVPYLRRERRRSTFSDDFRRVLTEFIPEERRTFAWYHPEHDPQGMYTVDCRINGIPKPLFVFALPSDGRTRDATIAIQQFERCGLSFHSLGIFEAVENINRAVLARFIDVCEKQFSSLGANKDRVVRYLAEVTYA